MSQSSSLNVPDCRNVVVSWTGGKDGCFSCYKALMYGCHVSHLLSFRDTKKRGSHDIPISILEAQSQGMGVPLVHRDFVSYEEKFKSVVRDLRRSGCRIDGAIFGHIQTHGRLVQRICEDLDLELIMPLWKRDSGEIMQEMICSGFEVVVSSVNATLLGPEWLGRVIDKKFISDITKLHPGIDLCGENGEFHTLVTAGPIMQSRINILESRRVLEDGYWHLEIGEIEVQDLR